MQPIDTTLDNLRPRRSAAEEIANTTTHFVGFLLSLLGGVALVSAVRYTGVGSVMACAAYTTTVVSMYAVSTLSHAVQRPDSKYVLRTWDQGVIYLSIAGTYTPLLWAFSPSPLVWFQLAAVWAASLVGFYFKVFVRHRVHEKFSVIPYILLGWAPTLMLLIEGSAPLGCIMWLVVGGLSYSVGTLFLKMEKKVRYFHATWHLFVIAGSACHFYAIYAFALRGSVTA